MSETATAASSSRPATHAQRPDKLTVAAGPCDAKGAGGEHRQRRQHARQKPQEPLVGPPGVRQTLLGLPDLLRMSCGECFLHALVGVGLPRCDNLSPITAGQRRKLLPLLQPAVKGQRQDPTPDGRPQQKPRRNAAHDRPAGTPRPAQQHGPAQRDAQQQSKGHHDGKIPGNWVQPTGSRLTR